jgi:hypothetical protein
LSEHAGTGCFVLPEVFAKCLLRYVAIEIVTDGSGRPFRLHIVLGIFFRGGDRVFFDQRAEASLLG